MNEDRGVPGSGPTRWRPAAWVGLAGWLVLCYAAAAVGAQFSPGPWYAALERPRWTPPAWLFGPVWTALYGMMGIAAWLVWKDRGFSGAPFALALFGLQLAVNALWSYLFFGLERPDLALADVILLSGLIVATLAAFHRIRPTAGWLLVPYLLWVSFAAALNFEIWRLNP